MSDRVDGGSRQSEKSALDVIDSYLSKRGCRLLVDNLHCDVGEEDLRFLFGIFGTVQRTAVFHDALGRSLGSGEVVFTWVTDALKALRSFNGVSLEGQPMRIAYAGRAPPRSGTASGTDCARVGTQVKFVPRRKRYRPRNLVCKAPPVLVTKETLDRDIEEYMSKRKKI